MKRKGLYGYLTVFLAMILLVFLPLVTGLLESCRERSMELKARIVADIGMNSAMADYHREVMNQYGLFFLDTSYKTREPSYKKTQNRLISYLSKNLEYEDRGVWDFLYYDFWGLKLSEVTLLEMELATDYEGRVFEREAITAMEKELGIEGGKKLLSYFEKARKCSLFSTDVGKQITQVRDKLEELDGLKVKISDKEWTIIEVTDPVEEVWKLRSKGILYLVSQNPGGISNNTVDLDKYVSQRGRRGALNQGNGKDPGKTSLEEWALFCLYCIRNSSNYLSPSREGPLCYEAEYLLSGTDNDTENLKKVAWELLGIREAANCITLSADRDKMKEIETMAGVCAAAIFSPQAAPIFQTVLFLGWSSLESMFDVKQLLQGERVPLLKEKQDWHYSLENMIKGLLDDSEATTKGLKYEDYLGLIMLSRKEKEIAYRFMDLIEMNIRLTEGNENFRMDACSQSIGAKIKIMSSYGYEFVMNGYKNYTEY